MKQIIALAVSVLFVHLQAAAHPQPKESTVALQETRYVMGTKLEITLYHQDETSGRKIITQAFAIAQRWDEVLSNYQAQSEVSHFNGLHNAKIVEVSDNLYNFLSNCSELSLRTNGAFDITVRPLTELWQRAAETKQLPSSTKHQEALSRTGWQHLSLLNEHRVDIGKAGIQLETGGVGKGYAVDEVVKYLSAAGVKRALVNFGQSSVYALGSPPGETAWHLLLKFPDENPLGLVSLCDKALSASDSFGRVVEIDGKRFGHIIDPLTGNALTEPIKAVVVTAQASEAEALTKYLLLRGLTDPQDQQQKVLGKDVEALVVDASGNQHHSKNFPFIELASY